MLLLYNSFPAYSKTYDENGLEKNRIISENKVGVGRVCIDRDR